MITELAFKPDFARTTERFDAWWRGEVIDRPPVTVRVRPTRSPREIPPPATMRQRWMNVEYAVDSAIARMEVRPFVGDTLPIYWPNIGPEITATLFGCDLFFDTRTSWSKPVVHSLDDWQQVVEREPDFLNPYWQAVEQMTEYAIAASRGRYLVGITDLHGNYDILAGLRDPQNLCLDLIDAPRTVRRAASHVSRAFLDCFCRLYAKVEAAGMGSTTWTPFYFPGPAYVPSCDFWCLVSDEIARDFVLPTILFEMLPLERSIFHLDGPQAVRHLDLLLKIEKLDAIQWVYGDGHGRAERWINTYKRIRDAGKSVQVLAADPADALAVLDAVGPEGVWLDVLSEFTSVEEAESFLSEVARRSRTKHAVTVP